MSSAWRPIVHTFPGSTFEHPESVPPWVCLSFEHHFLFNPAGDQLRPVPNKRFSAHLTTVTGCPLHLPVRVGPRGAALTIWMLACVLTHPAPPLSPYSAANQGEQRDRESPCARGPCSA